jgi:hypothetical protein
LPFSAIDAIAPAIEHTKQQLFRPFRLGQWLRLALVGLLAGELSSGGGCNIPSVPNMNSSHRGGSIGHLPGLDGGNLALLGGMIATIIIAAFVLSILFLYISSVMRFILFDSVLAKECHIREGWSRRQEDGWRFFLWKMLYSTITFVVLIMMLGIPAAFAFAMGWFQDPKQHLLPLILGGIILFFAVVGVVIAFAVIYVLTKDFVVPQMALEDIGAMEGWRRLWPMMMAEKGGYAGYVGMKILLAIGASIILGIVGFIFILIIFVPAAGVAIAAVVGAKAAGVGWTAGTITLAVVAGCVLLAIFFFISSLISVPAIVFFPAYSIYFFASRYPTLSALLYPAPPAPYIPPAVLPPPYQPPPLPPNPEPIG